MSVPASPNRRKLRKLRADAVPDDVVVVVRAAPVSVKDTISDIAVDALESGRTYVVQNERGEREPLFGVSVFAVRPGVPLIEVLSRFDEAPSYLEAQVGTLRSAKFVVSPRARTSTTSMSSY